MTNRYIDKSIQFYAVGARTQAVICMTEDKVEPSSYSELQLSYAALAICSKKPQKSM